MKRSNAVIGIILIIFGGLLLFSKYVLDIDILSLSAGDFWPIIVLGLGIIFESLYFTTRKNPGFLVPGGILTVTGCLFFFEVATDWRFAEYTWPVYILAAAFGLFQLYIFRYKNVGLLIPVSILAGVAGFAFISMIFNCFVSIIDVNIVIGIVLILIGIVVFARRRDGKSF